MALCDCQTETGAALGLALFSLLEGFEDAFPRLFSDARAGVLNTERVTLATLFYSAAQHRGWFLLR